MSECAQCQGNKISSQGAGICTECRTGSAANADKTGCGKCLNIAFTFTEFSIQISPHSSLYPKF